MSILSKMIGKLPAAPAPTASSAATPTAAAAPTRAHARKVLRSPFEEDMSKLARTPRGLSFAERSWTRES
jgi:hypothetical protein